MAYIIVLLYFMFKKNRVKLFTLFGENKRKVDFFPNPHSMNSES